MAIPLAYRCRIAAGLALLAGPMLTAAQPPPDLRVDGHPIEARLTSAFALPGQGVTICYLPSYRYLPEAGEAELGMASKTGQIVRGPGGCHRFLPGPGPFSDLKLTAEARELTLRVFRLVAPAALPGGPPEAFPKAALRGRQAPAYEPPAGYLPLTESLFETRVSTHFKLGQFAQKQGQGVPSIRYLALRTPLIEALEHLMTTLEVLGWEGETLKILSGFRSPSHNARVGGARYSRHIYGDAVDLIADADGDGRMDDLDGNGVSDREDVEWLIARFMRQALPVTLGGAGSYETAGPAAAFLHLDTRGQVADWQR